MFLLANVLAGVAEVLDVALNAYLWIIVISALLSWVRPDPYNPVVRFLNRATEPVLYQIRKRLPTNFGGIDFAPYVVVLAILFARRVLVTTLIDLAARLH